MSESAQQPSFEDILGRLEQITQLLETGDSRLEESLELFEEGTKLVKLGGARLDVAEKRLEVLQDNGQSKPLEIDSAGD